MGILSQTHNGLNFVDSQAYIQADGTTVMTIKSNGNVGIGASDPLRDLHVVGNFAVNAGTDEYYGVYIPGNAEGSDPQILIGDWHNASATITWDSSARALNLDTQYSTGAGTFNITGNDGASTFLTVNTSGNVGIGTTSPSAKLEVKNGTTGQSYSNQSGLLIDVNGTSNSYSSLHIGSSVGANNLVVTNAGNVGVGVSPSSTAKLHIVGSTTATDNALRVANSSNTPLMLVSNGGFVSINNNYSDYTLDVQKFTNENDDTVINIRSNWANTSANKKIGSLFFTAYDVDVDSGATKTAGGIRVFAENEWTSSANSNAYMNFNTLSGGSFGERMRITSGGNVGIGTTSPSEKLHVAGDSVITGGLAVGEHTTINANSYVIDAYRSSTATSGDSIGVNTLRYQWSGTNSGRVIGTYSAAQTSNTSTLTTAIGVYATARHTSSGTLTNAYSLYLDTPSGSPTNAFNLYAAGTSDNYFGGNVGIGTTSPSEKLEVKGNNISALIYDSTDMVNDDESAILKLRHVASTESADTFFSSSHPHAGINFEREWGSAGSTLSTLAKIHTYGETGWGGGLVFMTKPDDGVSSSDPVNVLDLTPDGEALFSGDVGIGTTSPTQKLDVNGDVKASNLRSDNIIGGGSLVLSTSGGANIELYGAGNAYYDAVSHVFRSANASSTAMQINTSTGNVGIGTTSPTDKLHVDGEFRVTNGVHNNTYVEHVTNDLTGADNANTNRKQYQFMELAYNTYHWSNGSPIIIEVMQTGFTGSEYAKYMLNWNYLDGGGTNEFILKVLENTSVNGNANNHRVIIGTPYDTGVDDGGYDLYALPLLLEAWYYCDYVVKVSFSDPGMSRIGTSTNFSVRAQYKFWDAPTATVISGTPSATEILPSPNSHAFYGALYGDGRLFNTSTTNNIGNITNYFVDPANSTTSAQLSGKVGIGTTSPSQKLHVAGTGRFTGNLYSTSTDVDGIKTRFLSGAANNSTNNGTLYLQYGKSNPVSIGETGSSSLYVAGNVGIGTTSPASNLHIKTSVDNSVTQGLVIERSANSDKGYINYNGGGFQFRSTVGDPIVFGETDAEHMRILPDGNVGIGTDSPDFKLDTRISRASGSFLTDGLVYALGLQNTDTTAGNATAMTFGHGGYEYTNFIASVRTGTGANPKGDLVFGGRPSDGASFAEGMRILANGNVGIDTTSPQALLQVGSVTSSVYSLATGNADIIAANKDISDTQMGTLNVTSTSRRSSSPFNQGYGPSITFTQNGSGYVDGYEKVIGGIKTEIRDATNLDFASIMQFYTHNNSALTAKMTIDAGGNVGIGTTSPSYKFTVAGSNGDFGVGSTGNDLYFTRNAANYFYATGASSSFRFYTAGVEKLNLGNTNSYFPNGNVGIGTTSPTSKLHVSGSVNFTETVVMSGFAPASTQLLTVGTDGTVGTAAPYTAGSGLNLSSGEFSIESDLRDGITRVGKDNDNYIAIDADNNNSIDFYISGVWVARMEADGDLHMKGDVIAFSDIFNP
jgi:hypothetical protein